MTRLFLGALFENHYIILQHMPKSYVKGTILEFFQIISKSVLATNFVIRDITNLFANKIQKTYT